MRRGQQNNVASDTSEERHQPKDEAEMNAFVDCE